MKRREPSCSPAARRRGAMLFEAMMAVAILSAATIVVAQSVVMVARQRRLAERRACALEEAANVMERVFGMPWQDLTAETAGRLQLSASCRQRLPGARLHVHVQPIEAPVRGKRVHVAIEWHGRPSTGMSPVRLTAWRFAPPEGQP